MGRRIADLVLAAPRTIAALLLVATFALGSGARHIRILDDLTNVIPPDNPARQAAAELENTFGASETVVLMLRDPGGDALSAAMLGELKELKDRLESAPEVARVLGLATLDRYVRDAEGALQAQPLIAQSPVTPAAAEAIAGYVRRDDDVRHAFVAPDGASTALYVDPRPGTKDNELLAALTTALEPTRARFEVHWTGMAVIRDATTRSIRADMLLLMPLVALVLIVTLWLSLGSKRAVAMTFGVVVLSIVPAAGAMGFLGLPLTAVNNTFPILILATSCGYAIHIITGSYARLRDGRSPEHAVRHALDDLALPVLLSALTTVAGFLSLVFSPIPPVGTLGIVVAVGVAWAWLLASFLLPAILLVVPPPRHLAREGAAVGRAERWFRPVWRAPLAAPAVVAGLVVVSTALLAGVGIPRVERETRVERFFFAAEPARRDAEAIDAAFHGSTPLEMIVHHDVNDPDVLRRVLAFSRAAQALDFVGSVDSIATVLARMQEGFAGQREIPGDSTQVAQALFLYGLSAPPERYQRFVATDEQSYRLTVRMPNLPPRELEQAVAVIDALLAQHLADVDVAVTGKALFLKELNRLMVQSTTQSIVASLVLVFLITLVSFRSPRVGMESVAPISLAVVGVFGIMGLLGLPLTIATALVTSIVIGTGIDFAVHVLAKFAITPGPGLRDRLEATLDDSGYRILVNAVGVGGGLGVLGFSRFEPIRQLGLLAVASMFGAALGALWIIPLLKSIGKRKEVPHAHL